MVLISHRGNINGRFESYENEPNYIDTAILKGYDVEVDVWVQNNVIYLGHDKPQYGVNYEWMKNRIKKMWIHCKNIESIVFFNSVEDKFNFFWHETDTVTLTSKGVIWAYPGNQPILNSISVMPEINNEDTSMAFGVCSDFIERYNND